MKTYAFIPARSITESIANKNTRILNGTPLYINALEKLLKCKEIDKVFLDTDSQEMFEKVDYLPIEFMKRDISLASNKTDGHKLFYNEVASNPDADIYVQLLCTAPFIEPETIDKGIRILKDNPGYDSVVLMKKDKYYFWENSEPLYNKDHIPNIIDLPDTFSETMGLYICRKEIALQTKRRYGNSSFMMFGKLNEQIDVNDEDDLIFAESYANGLKYQENAKYNLLKHFISSSSLSDIIDEVNAETGRICGGVLDGFTSNIKAVLLGRATTLRLRTLKDNENYLGIYDALQSYNEMSHNDIIVVENEENKYAYFGDLNASLAIRKGVSGVIVDGNTRDKNRTSSLHFPVFCKGYNPKDVKKRAVLDYYNKPIKIDSLIINPKDLIFADECGIVVIYREFENEVINRVMNTFETEKNIVKDIAHGKDSSRIIDDNGNF